MSILIKGMEMPDSCEKCLYSSWSNYYQIYVCNAIWKDEPVLFNGKQIKSTAIARSGRADNCPLVPVPTPHGDLIDRKKLLENAGGVYTARPEEAQKIQHEINKVLFAIQDAPTVIEAEGE